ncbi:hypothetical protein UFOVP275_30 [uncultured Caudovirales phage]|uniref:Uncharacterized protein n=1 Tax=uncultured Caudovirales phage TaxID=2100421 RepID=A0A6J5LNN1_9CAUD|nr:hypothetical protein UFOVP275_30 [uncultured Caudovirales phage]
MATYASKWSDPGANGNTYTADRAGDVIRQIYEIDLAVAPFKGVTFLANDIVDIGTLPAYHTVSDVIIDTDDMDSNGTPLISLDVGMLSGTVGDVISARTMGNEFFAADTTARTGGVARMTKSAGMRIGAVAYDRSIGVKFAAAAATQATSGKIRIIVEMQTV